MSYEKAGLTIEQRARHVVGSHLGVHPIGLKWDATLAELDADSLDIVEIAMNVEEEFGVTIPDDQSAEWIKAQDILDSVEKAVAHG